MQQHPFHLTEDAEFKSSNVFTRGMVQVSNFGENLEVGA